MGFRADVSARALTITLSGRDRLLNLRSRVVIDRDDIAQVRTVPRSEVVVDIDHRVSGVGTHDGSRRPGRRRVGTMMGRAVVGRQFWAVSSGEPDQTLVVVEMVAGCDPARLVLEVDHPDDFVARLAADRV